MDFASATIPEVSELRPITLPQEAAGDRRLNSEAQAAARYFIAKRLYGVLTALFALSAFAVFIYFGYRACGWTGVTIASGATVGTLWSLVRFVLLC